MRGQARLGYVLILAALPALAADTGDLAQRWDKVRRVTLQSDKIRVARAVEKICKLAKQPPVVIGARGDYQIALDLKDATFFQALDEVALRAGLALKSSRSWFGEEYRSALHLVAQPEGMKRVPPVHAGPARLSLVGIYAEKSAGRLFSPEASEPDDNPSKLWVEMRCRFEPGFENVFPKEIVLDKATDDADRSLLGKETKFDDVDPDDPIRLELKAPDRGSLKVSDLRGRFVLYLPVKTVELKYTGGSRKSTKKVGNARFVFHKLSRKGGDDGKPLLVVDLEGHPCKELANYSYREMAIQTGSYWSPDRVPVGIYLYDRDGKPIGARSSSIRDTLSGKTGARFTLDRYPHRILVRAVAKVKKKEIRFRFTDLPIPR